VKDKPKIVVWDSCVIIDAIQKLPPERYALIGPFIKDAENKKLKIVISEISIAEVTHLNELGKQGVSDEEQFTLINDWLENPYIVRRPVHRGISDLAVEIKRQHKLKRAADRIIIATAQFEKISLIHTFDGTDRTKKNKILPLDGKIYFETEEGREPIRIMTPDPDFGTLFEKKNVP